LRNWTIALAAAASLGSVPAMAQETTADLPFRGAYIGVAGGYDIQGNDSGSSIRFDRNLDGSFNDTVTTAAGANAFSPGFCAGRARAATPAPGCDNDRDGWSYYARAGIDHQIGNLVYGIVGEFGKSEITDSVSGFSTTPANYVMTRTVDWEAGARSRLGYAVNTTLFYGTFGVGYARIDREYASTNVANARAERGRRNQLGVQAGGGIEQKIGNNFSFGLEMLFHEYDDDDYRVRLTQGTAPATNPFVLAPNTAGTDLRRSDDMFRWYSLRATAAFRF
jgi:outer membrane immunogenic protein